MKARLGGLKVISMNIMLSETEYRHLIMLAYLGEWMVNAVRKEPDPLYEDTANKIYEAARGTPLESLIAFDEPLGVWGPADHLDRDAHALIDEYDETTFWEELTARLTERDLIERFGERTYKSMRPQAREREVSAQAKLYTKEFETDGLDRLRILED